MSAASATATQPAAALMVRSVVVPAGNGNVITFDLPRGR
jgi:hypothetical protein